MKKINLAPYTFNSGNKEPLEINVKEQIATLIVNDQLQLNGPNLLKNYRLSEKFKNETKDHILLENEEYVILENAVNIVKGFPVSWVEILERIINAEDHDINAN